MNMLQLPSTVAKPREIPQPFVEATSVDDSSAMAASRSLLAELTGSLQGALASLLARDLDRLEQCTREQLRLQHTLSVLWTSAGWSLEGTRDGSVHGIQRLAELRPAVLHILHLGRVNAALLLREQRWLSLLTNLLSGPATAYGPPGLAATVSRGSNHDGSKRDGSNRDGLNRDDLNHADVNRQGGANRWGA